MHQITPEWPWTFNSQKYRGPNFGSALQPAVYEIQGCLKSEQEGIDALFGHLLVTSHK